ncbi:MAG TPA: POTRA domain-containing protein [Terracidiphilus sp.]|nr:POTRA domain-containing protein [Terracidiphilus sp.]
MICSAAIAAGCLQTNAQAPNTSLEDQILSSYEGQAVTSVGLAGRPNLQESQFESEIAQKAGQPFAKQQIDATSAALKSAGIQDVRVRVAPEANGLRVVFVLEPAMYYGIYQFPGAERFPYARLIQVANYVSQAPYDSAEVEHDRQRLLRFYQQEGFFEAQVTTELKVDEQHGIVNVIFQSALGHRARFGEIVVEGLSSAEAKDFQNRLRSKMARFRGAAIREGKTYKHSTLNRAVNFMQSRLQSQGFLAAGVKLAGVEYHADTNRADIHFTANPGQKTEVKIAGARLWPWTRRDLLPEYQGVGVDDETVHEGEQALASYFQAKGYFDVNVTSKMSGDASHRTVLYNVTKGRKHRVTAVRITGAKQLKESDLSPRVTVRQRRFLSRGQFSDQLVRTSVKNLTAVYQSQGFSTVQVTPSVARNNGNIEVSFHIVEGPRDIVNSLAIDGADTFPQSQFAPKGLKLAVGQPYSQANVQTDRAEIVANYLKAGYLNASFRETAAQVSKNDPHLIDVVYHIYEGPRVFTGDIVTLGRVRTQQRLIDQDVAAIKPDQPLTETKLLMAGTRLYDHTGVFDWAEVNPKSQITTQTSEDALVKVHEAKRNELTYGFGFEILKRGGSIPSGTVTLPNLPPVGLPPNFVTNEVTFYGPRGSFQYTRNNLWGRGQSLSFTAFAGRLDQRGAVYFIDPYFRWSSWKSTVSFSAERNEENPLYSSQQVLASYQLQRYIDGARHNLLFLRYSFSKTDLYRIEIPELVPPEDQHVQLSGFAANLTRDTRDNVLDARKGVLGSIQMDINSSKLGANFDFAELSAQGAFYKEKFHHIVWAESIRIGLAQPFANSTVPLSEKFFTGGADSLRGFPLDGAGPQRKVGVCTSTASCDCPNVNCAFITVPAGGNQLLLINSEARIPLPFKKGLSVVGFYDGGNVFPGIGFHDFTALYTNTIGFGFRYSTPIGPIRFDLGHNLNPVPGVNPTQYFVTIGQAF